MHNICNSMSINNNTKGINHMVTTIFKLVMIKVS